MFGQWKDRCIDYIALDEISCQIEHHGLIAKDMAIPSDHIPIGVCIIFRYGWNEAEWARRGKQKPIGWKVRAENADELAEYMRLTHAALGLRPRQWRGRWSSLCAQFSWPWLQRRLGCGQPVNRGDDPG